VISFILAGKESMRPGFPEVTQSVQMCVDHNADGRYRTVLDLIADAEGLAATPTDAPG
jgi:hypothetical protein